ncbi:MAG: hypothetical protein KME18_07645 [Phormidium tanganyikae FI6-MK23]|jgi:hypothetical protein|nr:hypothetical protein [Phormidium tanganyikae FI6-MK23]
MSALIINQKLLDDPFRVIYYKALESFDIHTLADRIEFLDRLADGIHQVENDIKNSTEQGGWLGIVSGFAAAMSIGAFVSLPILPVAVLGFMGATSAIVGIGNTVNRKFKLSPVQEELERHYLALRSTESINWAALWDYCHKSDQNGDETFRHLLFKASRGSISGDRLIRSDSTKEPFIAANKALASRQGREAGEVATFVRAIKESFLSQQPKPVDSGWVPMPQPTDQPKAIGSETRLNAVEVPSQSVEVPVQSVEPHQSKTPLFANSDINPAVLQMPLKDRALFIIDAMKADGFQIDAMLQNALCVIAGQQRGGKGTLLGILSILFKAINNSKIHYYTANADYYPISVDRLVCADSFPTLDPEKRNARVFDALIQEVSDLQKFEHYERKDLFLVIDEAITLSASGDSDKNREMAKYLLMRFAKSGAQGAVVLHAGNLSAWLGAGNTGGMAQTFKQGSTFIGCKSKSIPDDQNPLKPVTVATGEYFVADPDHFGESVPGGGLGKMPEWLLFEQNPYNGAPDPVRSLLRFFPEFHSENPVTICDVKKQLDIKPKSVFNPQPPIASTREQLDRLYESSPSADHGVEEDAIEVSSSMTEIQSAFPKWKPKSLEVASLIVDYLRKKSSESLTSSRLKSDIRKIKDDGSLTNERLKAGLLPQLVEKGFLTEDDGRYSAAQDDYDF